MSNFGQAALTVVGTAVGAFFGGPIGAEIGFSLGSVAGNLIFPTNHSSGAPKIGDTSVTTASEGAVIPILFGVPRQAGVLVWSRPIHAVTTTQSSGGKGSPGGGVSQQVTNYYFTGAYKFGVGGLGPAKNLQRLWVDKKLVYDVTPGADEKTLAASDAYSKNFKFYLGDEAQNPDPTIQAFEGVAPNWRGHIYMVFHDLDVTLNGARAPQVDAEIVMDGAVVHTADIDRTSNILFEWVPDEHNLDPRSCQNDHEYLYNSTIGWTSDLSVCKAAMVNDFFSGAAPDGYLGPSLMGWALDDSTYFRIERFQPAPTPPGETAYLALHFSIYPCDLQLGVVPTSDPFDVPTVLEPSAPPLSQVFFWSGYIDTGSGPTAWEEPATYFLAPESTPFTFVPSDAPPGLAPIGYWQHRDPPHPTDPPGGINNVICRAFTKIIYVRRIPRQPDNPCHPRCVAAPPSMPGTSDYCVIDGALVRSVGYNFVGARDGVHRYRWLADYIDTSGNTDRPTFASDATGAVVSKYPLGPAIPIGDPRDTEAFWVGAAAEARAAGFSVGDSYASGDNADYSKFPITKSYAWERDGGRDSTVPTLPTVGQICAALTKLAGIDETLFNYSALTRVVHSYAVARSSTARDAMLVPLQYQFGDITEIGGQLIGIARGGAPVLTLTADALGAHDSTSETPALVTITRTQSADLTRLLRVHFVDVTYDSQAGQQSKGREYGPETQPTDLELALGMTPDQALQVADIKLNEIFTGREQYAITLPATDALLNLKPAQNIVLPVEGRLQLARVVTTDYQFPSLITVALARSSLEDYASIATVGGGGLPALPPQAVGVVGPTDLIIVDLPALRASDTDAGTYLAAYGHFAQWNGCLVYESKDGGGSYTRRVAFSEASFVGKILAALPTGSDTVIDNTTTLGVSMTTGLLSSVAESALASGANAFAIGAPGRWTIIQARDCVLQMDGSYLLGGLLQGLVGTAASCGTSIAGDYFIVLDSRIHRLTEGAADIGKTYLLRAVSTGTALGDALDVSYTVSGLSYVPALTGSPAPGQIVVGSTPSTTPGSPTTTVPSVASGAVLLDQGSGVAPAFKVISGDAMLAPDGTLTATRDTDPALAANSDARTASQKAVKAYVDNKVNGLAWKSPAARAATTGALPANTYSNGSAGVGATLTGNSNGALPAQDGVTLVVNDSLLVKNEGAAANNGIYTLTQVGDGSHPFILTRRQDADSGSELVNATVYVSEGTPLLAGNADTQWTCISNGPITVGTTSLVWALCGTGIYDWANDIHSVASKTAPADSDELGLLDSATSFTKKKLTWANLKAGIWSAWGALIAAGTAKTTPVDADALAIADSAASNATKSLSWANLKATLKSYFDTLYVSTGGAGGKFVRGVTWTNGGVAIYLPADYGDLYFPIAATITRITVLTQGGPDSCQIALWVAAYGSFPPTSGGDITGGHNIVLSAASKLQDNVLSGWTTTIAAGSTLRCSLVSTAAFTAISLTIEIQT